MADDGSWWDDLTNSVGGIFKQPEQKPVMAPEAMARYHALIDQSMSPEDAKPYKGLLEAFAAHANGVPMPRQASGGQMLVGGGLSAISDALRTASGGSRDNPAAARFGDDLQSRRERGDQARLAGWKDAGERMLPFTANAVSSGLALKRLRETANMQARNYGQEPIYDTGTAPPATGGPEARPSVASPPSGVPGISVAPATPPSNAAPAAGAQPASSLPSIDERPHKVGNVSFYTPEWAGQFQRGLRALLTAPGTGTTIPVKNNDGVTVNQEIKSPSDLERVALQEDQKAYQASTPYKAREMGMLEETKGVIANNQKQLEGYQSAAKAAMSNNNVIALMDQALTKAQSSGQLGVGTGNAILGPINSVLERLGAPHLQQGAYSMIKELQNRAGVEAASEEVSSGRGPGQRIMQTFLAAVPGADMTESGFVAASAAIKAINAYYVASGQMAEKLMSEPGSHSRRDLQSQVAKMAQPYFEDAVKKAQAAIDLGVAPKAAPQVAPEEKLPDDQVKVITDRAKALFAQGNVTKEQAAARAREEFVSQRPTPGPAKVGAPPPTQEEPAAATPPRPKSGAVMQKVWDWSYPDQARELARIRKLKESLAGSPMP